MKPVSNHPIPIPMPISVIPKNPSKSKTNATTNLGLQRPRTQNSH